MGIAGDVDNGSGTGQGELGKNLWCPPPGRVEQYGIEEGISSLEAVGVSLPDVGLDAEGSCVVAGVLDGGPRRLDQGDSARGVGEAQAEVANARVQVEQVGGSKGLEACSNPRDDAVVHFQVDLEE